MSLARRVGVGLVGAVLMVAAAACRPTFGSEAQPGNGRQALSTPPQSGHVVWGRVPYCNCLAGAATANVASALQDANLAVTLKELSPRDGWLYFAATFDPSAAASDRVVAALATGGAEVIEGPP